MTDRLAPLLSWPDVTHRRMMGADCFLVGGRMFVILPPDGTAAMKLPEPERGRYQALPGGGPFVVSRGAFGTWAKAPLRSLDDQSLIAFARAACEHVRGLPPAKQSKRTSRRRA